MVALGAHDRCPAPSIVSATCGRGQSFDGGDQSIGHELRGVDRPRRRLAPSARRWRSASASRSTARLAVGLVEPQALTARPAARRRRAAASAPSGDLVATTVHRGTAPGECGCATDLRAGGGNPRRRRNGTVRGAGQHVVQAAAVGAEDQRRDRPGRSAPLRSSARSRFSGRAVAVDSHDPEPGGELAERAAGQGGETARLERRTRRACRSRRRRSSLPVAATRPATITTRVQATQSTTEGQDPARPGGGLGTAASAGTRQALATVPRAPRPGHLLHRAKQTGYGQETAPAYVAGVRRSVAPALTAQTCRLRLSRPRRTNVRKQRRAAQVHQGRGRRDGRRPLLRPARHHAALHRARSRRSTSRSSTTASTSTAPRSAASRRSTSPTCRCSRTRRRRTSTRSGPPRRWSSTSSSTTRSPARPTRRDPRNIARKAMAYLASTGIGDTAYFAPEAEFYVFDSVRFETKRERRASTTSTPRPAPGTPAPRTNNRGYKVRYKGGYFPVAPYDHFGELRDEMVIELEKSGLHRRARPPRGRHRRPGGDQLPVRRAAQGRRRRDEVQVHRQERRLAQRQDRDLHAEADLRRQRLGHARATSRSGTTASRCSTTRPGTPACPTWRATTSAASSSTPRRCWRSPTRR